MAFNSFIYNNQPMTFNGFAIGSGYVPPTPPTPEYSGFTYAGNINRIFSIDPAYMCAKQYNYSYLLDLENNIRYENSQLTGNDGMALLVSADKRKFCMMWDDRDIASTSSYSVNSWNSYGLATAPISEITEIYSLDFWHKKIAIASNVTTLFQKASIIPNNSALYFNGESITSVQNMFRGNTNITQEIIPVISSIQAACPNLQKTNYCFSGCVNAADYAQALAQYPGWF